MQTAGNVRASVDAKVRAPGVLFTPSGSLPLRGEGWGGGAQRRQDRLFKRPIGKHGAARWVANALKGFRHDAGAAAATLSGLELD